MSNRGPPVRQLPGRLCVAQLRRLLLFGLSRANPSDFSRDERTCRMMCPEPANRALLPRRRCPGQRRDVFCARPDTYTEMPNGFFYRNANATMSKRPRLQTWAHSTRRWSGARAILNGRLPDEAPVTTWVHPVQRPDPGEDPRKPWLRRGMPLTSEDVRNAVAFRVQNRAASDRGAAPVPLRRSHLSCPTIPSSSDLKAAPPSLIR